MKKTAHVLMCSLLMCLFAMCFCLPGCVSAEVELTSESRATDGTVKITRKRFSTFALYESAVKQGIASVGSIGGSLWEMVPDEVKAIGAGALGLGGVGVLGGLHSRSVRKHKEKSFNKALQMRLGPPEIAAGVKA